MTPRTKPQIELSDEQIEVLVGFLVSNMIADSLDQGLLTRDQMPFITDRSWLKFAGAMHEWADDIAVDTQTYAEAVGIGLVELIEAVA